MYAYCLFCQTQRCAAIARYIQATTGMRCFTPQIIQRKWVHGEPLEEKHSWLPGYVFLYTPEPIQPIRHVDGVIRWLCDSKQNYELSGEDYDFAMMLLQKDGIIGTVRLAQVGDRVHLTDGAWAGMNGSIIRVDRQRKRCCVEFRFDATVRNVWVGYEIVETDDPEA